MPTTEAIRQRLFLRRRELLSRYRDELARVEEELDQHNRELGDVASEQWDAQVLSRLGTADVHAITAVTAALERLERGAYGTCTSCHAAIAVARLHALPEAAICIDCARRHAMQEVVA